MSSSEAIKFVHVGFVFLMVGMYGTEQVLCVEYRILVIDGISFCICLSCFWDFSKVNHIFSQVFCYALSANDNTEWRQRIQSEAEHFLDVSSMSADAIAKIINEDKIQILINLNGYTKACSEHFRNFIL